MILLELRKLLHIKVFKESSNQFYFRIMNDHKFKNLRVRTSYEGLVRFLIKIKAKDTATLPRSMRRSTYKLMATNIIEGIDNEIYVWQYKWFVDTFKIKEM